MKTIDSAHQQYKDAAWSRPRFFEEAFAVASAAPFPRQSPRLMRWFVLAIGPCRRLVGMAWRWLERRIMRDSRKEKLRVREPSRLRSVCPQRQPSTTKGCVGVQSRQKLDKNDCDRTRGIDCDDSPNARSESKATLPRTGMDAWIYRILPKPKAKTAKEGGRQPPRSPSVLDLGRRSLSVPPEPCPPPKQLNF